MTEGSILRGLPPTLKLKILKHNPTPKLDEMVELNSASTRLVIQPRRRHLPYMLKLFLAHRPIPS